MFNALLVAIIVSISPPFKVLEALASFINFTPLIAFPGAAQKQNYFAVHLCEVNTYYLSKFEFMQATAKILPAAKMVIFLNCSKPSLNSPFLCSVEFLEPLLERSATILSLVYL
jgi:hypothetical protein